MFSHWSQVIFFGNQRVTEARFTCELKDYFVGGIIWVCLKKSVKAEFFWFWEVEPFSFGLEKFNTFLLVSKMYSPCLFVPKKPLLKRSYGFITYLHLRQLQILLILCLGGWTRLLSFEIRLLLGKEKPQFHPFRFSTRFEDSEKHIHLNF